MGGVDCRYQYMSPATNATSPRCINSNTSSPQFGKEEDSVCAAAADEKTQPEQQRSLSRSCQRGRASFSSASRGRSSSNQRVKPSTTDSYAAQARARSQSKFEGD